MKQQIPTHDNLLAVGRNQGARHDAAHGRRWGARLLIRRRILFHPDCYRRFRNRTGSAGPFHLKGARGLPIRVTAGGDLHPALRIVGKSYTCRARDARCRGITPRCSLLPAQPAFDISPQGEYKRRFTAFRRMPHVLGAAPFGRFTHEQATGATATSCRTYRLHPV
jgi:hypothetical protein